LVLMQNGFRLKLYFTTETDFFIIEAPGAAFSFTKDSQGKVDGVQQMRGTNVMKAAKVI